MKTTVTIREYARLTTQEVQPSLDLAQVSQSAFDWLCDFSGCLEASGASVLKLTNRRTLKWDSYVGVLETPCGTRLEILPKHHEEDGCIGKSRQLLRKLIQNALQLKPRKAGAANVEAFDAPLSEWVMEQFLSELDLLLKRGIRFDYERVEEEQRYLRGQLNAVVQMRQPPGRQHYFQIRHDIFLPDRAENRLLKLAVDQVAKLTTSPRNWRLATELQAFLASIRGSRNIAQDLRAWSDDRLMSHYRLVKPWCELILSQHVPLAVLGRTAGMSLLFPMERLFERYVQDWLQRHLIPEAKMTAQSRSKYLCEHDDRQMFCLRPDILIDLPAQRWILDTKWKRIDAGKHEKNYHLSQADFYQLFAYGHQYRTDGGAPNLFLVYPCWSGLQAGLPAFDYGRGLRLWVLPFDLEAGRLVVDERHCVPIQTPN
ncbi:McrC family protein [Pseudomonas asiatica]|uniref:McrC family protein n=1 Tax=Pseudomonas asiatica TaxID=2219225 RepID=UPI0011D7D6F7|nr:McrC family protein [Pseudomonas asiatica]TXG97460.1 MAG: restriction endonuclease [Nevskiaceae bacterium]